MMVYKKFNRKYLLFDNTKGSNFNCDIIIWPPLVR